MDTSQHDELARLFARNMHLAQQQKGQEQQQQQQTQFSDHNPNYVFDHLSEKQAQESPIHYISTHYTGSAHILPPASPPPPYNPTNCHTERPIPDAMIAALNQNSIDPSALLPAQIHLFLDSDSPQRLRLLELWRTAPPSYPLEDHLKGHWQTTNMVREETEARMRYERKMQNWQPQPVISSHAEPSRNQHQQRQQDGDAMAAEPYILSVYSQHATDPVYVATPAANASQGLWQPAQAQNAMIEDQYGAFDQIRNHAEWEATNERIARERLRGFGGSGSGGRGLDGDGDDEMVM